MRKLHQMAQLPYHIDRKAMLLLIGFISAVRTQDEWSYEGSTGPDHWKDLNLGGENFCGGNQQSPVDIDPSKTVFEGIPPLVFFGYDIPLGSVTLTNDHYSAKLAGFDGRRYVAGGPLRSRYYLDSFHLHWGQNGNEGSEHTLRGRQFAAEIHLVHYKAEYGNLTQASNHPDGIVVLGILVEESWYHDSNDYPQGEHSFDGFNDNNQIGYPNYDFNEYPQFQGDARYGAYSGIVKVVRMIHSVSGQKTITVPSSLILMELLPYYLSDVYFYKGSLTTPRCNEVVQWIIFRQRILAPASVLARLRDFRDAEGRPVPRNWRPVQPLNGRRIFRSWRREWQEYPNYL